MEDLLRALLFIMAFGAVFVGCMALEAWYCHRTGRSEYYDFKETLANLFTGASYKIVDGLAIAFLITAFYDYIKPYGLNWNPELSVWSILVAIVAADLGMYVTHAMAHKVRWFWTVHSTHHSSANMNLSTALRQNFINGLNGYWILLWVPLALVGFDKNWALIAIEGNLVYQFFLHTKVYNAPKWWGIVFNTPSHHRVHHGHAHEQIDRNFGGVLIIWDKLFGTFQAEETAGEIKFGVPRMPAKPYNPIRLQIDEFIDMWKDIIKYKDLRILVMPPEWVSSTLAPKFEQQSQTKSVVSELDNKEAA